MPNWQPNWQDVRWNWGEAEHAASELDRQAGELDSTSAARHGIADMADAQWQGAFRDRFDVAAGEAYGQSWNLAGFFRETAARIRAASDRARAEQAHRVAERERWRREKDDEDRRAREAARRKAQEKIASTQP